MALSLYIHFPFCTNLCSYCDFYKVRHDENLEAEYFRALATELNLAADSIEPDKRKIETIYLGGGTPSLIEPALLEKLLSDLKSRFTFKPNLEFTLEINPESIDAERLTAYKELGVNRPVFGIQSFNIRLLKTLNRRHKLDDSFRAVYLARVLGLDNFGIDMIFGLPKQTGKRLSDDLNQLIDLSPPHVSYYQLTVEKNTPLEKKITGGKLRLPADDMTAAMYLAVNLECKKHNLHRYEVSSFALPGHECRHNLRYWEGGEYLGLGPSAHSFIENRRFANSPDLKLYFEKLSAGHRPLVFDTDNIESRMAEAIMLGLRTSRGISRKDFLMRFGIPAERIIDTQNLRILSQANLIDPGKEYIRLTDTGFPLADEIIRRLVK